MFQSIREKYDQSFLRSIPFEISLFVGIMASITVLVLALMRFLEPPPMQKVELYYNEKPFTALSFSQYYMEGARYIKLWGSVDGVEDDYIFDLADEKVLSFIDHEYLLNPVKRYKMEVYEHGIYKTYDNKTPDLIEIRNENPDSPMEITIIDSLGSTDNMQIDVSILDGYRDTEFIHIYFSEAGRYAEIFFSKHNYLADLIKKEIIIPPEGFGDGKGFWLYDDDRIAVRDEKIIWDIEKNTVRDLGLDDIYEKDKVKYMGLYNHAVSRDGKYIFWGYDKLKGCNVETGEITTIFDGKGFIKPDFDFNNIKFISEHEVGAVGFRFREWYEFGFLPGESNTFILKYNMQTKKLKKIKLGAFAVQMQRLYAWSYDESAVYGIKTKRQGMYKIEI